VVLPPVPVIVTRLVWLDRRGGDLRIRISAAAGFYVRALARDLGTALGCGAHLSALRRVASGAFDVEAAVRLDEALTLGPEVVGRLLSPAAALPHLAGVRVTERGLRRALHGNSLNSADLLDSVPTPEKVDAARPVKILDASGRLIALAQVRGGALHPVVVLG
jgi:tRNA pseudouridine55 synthase